MRIIDFTKKIIKDFLIIFSIIVITLTLIRQINSPNEYFEFNELITYMIFSMLGALPGFIFYSNVELTNKQMQFRILIHFIVLEISILTLGNIMGLVNDFKYTFVFGVQIAIIYLFVRFLSWMDDRKDARKINEKIKQLKKL